MSRLSLPIRQTLGVKRRLIEAKRDGAFYRGSRVDHVRSLGLRVTGKVKFEGPRRPLLVGRGCDFMLDVGATIVSRAGHGPRPDPRAANNPFFPHASTLGGAGYWRYLDHPTGRRTRVRLKENAVLALHPDAFVCRGAYLSVWEGVTLEIGTGVYIGNDVLIATSLGLTVGAHTMVGLGTVIMDYDGHPIDFTSTEPSPVEEQPGTALGGTKARITIGEHVWIGFHCTILKGVRIGEGAVVGSRSVVTRDVPPHTVVGGNPARIIKDQVIWRP